MTDRTRVPSLLELSLPEAVSRARGAGVPALLDRDGAVLIRDARVTTAAALATLATQLGLTAADQLEPFAPRRDLGHGVWSQLAWPSTSPMCMHHELGWQRRPPPYLVVACLVSPTSGGRTAVADGRVVLSLLPDRLVHRAGRHGWLLLRRYDAGLFGMPWEQAFSGMDRAAVTAYAAAEGIDLEWEPGRLLTRRCRPAIRPTGIDGAPAWSNLLAFCSEWTMDPAVRDFLLATVGRSSLQFETAFGDGSPFPAADVETVHAAYDRAAVRIAWRAGDVLVLDNIRTAHSTEAFTGEREMAVMHATAAITG